MFLGPFSADSTRPPFFCQDLTSVGWSLSRTGCPRRYLSVPSTPRPPVVYSRKETVRQLRPTDQSTDRKLSYLPSLYLWYRCTVIMDVDPSSWIRVLPTGRVDRWDSPKSREDQVHGSNGQSKVEGSLRRSHTTSTSYTWLFRWRLIVPSFHPSVFGVGWHYSSRYKEGVPFKIKQIKLLFQ